VEVLLTTLIDQETMDTIFEQIDQADWFDDDSARAEVIQKDVIAGLVTKETAASLRGYDKKEPAKARMEKSLDIDSLLGEGGGATDADRIPSPGQDAEDVTDPPVVEDDE
jgi:hypothetical protein